MSPTTRFRYEDVIDAPMGSVAMALDARLRAGADAGTRLDLLTYEFSAQGAGRLLVTIHPVTGTATTRVLIEELGRGGRLPRLRRWLRCRSLMTQLSVSARGIHRSGPPRGPQGGIPARAERYRRLGLVPIETREERGPRIDS
ncbi:MAG: hypothetical protein NVSMB29_09410 [Candidatus Dormibacteria bacterium]